MFWSMHLRKLTWANIEQQLNINIVKRISKDVCELVLHALHVETLCYELARPISKQGWIQVHHAWSNHKPIPLNYVHIFWASGNNDINFLDQSPLICYLLNMPSHDFDVVVNGTTYLCYYFLTNNIYLPWSYFLQTLHKLKDAKNQCFAMMHEDVRKDVERCFWTLQPHFAIIHNHCKLWHMETIYKIMVACVIFHNMIVKEIITWNLCLNKQINLGTLKQGLAFLAIDAKHWRVGKFTNSLQFKIKPCRTLVDHEGPQSTWLK
jgi:hypothetical protein